MATQTGGIGGGGNAFVIDRTEAFQETNRNAALPPIGRAYLPEDKKRAARDNDSNTIEELFTSACSGDAEGQAAARFLFNLYVGYEGSSELLVRQLSRDSLKLCELVAARNAKKPQADWWIVPTEILIMAGFETTGGSQSRSDIVERIKVQEPGLCSYIADEQLDSAIFAQNRLVTSAELDSVSHHLNNTGAEFYFCGAHSISDEAVHHQHLDEQLLSVLNPRSPPAEQERSSGTFIPLLLRGHWVLFGLLDQGQDKSAVLFSSLTNLDSAQKEHLTNLAERCGARCSFVERNLQDNAPNACGLFVAEAMRRVADVGPSEVVSKWHEFSDTFATLDGADQATYNCNGRAELFGDLIERYRSIRDADFRRRNDDFSNV